MTNTTIIILTAMFSINIVLIYSMYQYFEGFVTELNTKFDSRIRFNNDRIETLRDYVSEIKNSNYILEIHKLRDEMQNNALCCQNGIHRAIRDIVDIRTDLEELTKKIEASQSMVATNCCKSHMKKLNQDAFKFETRLRRMEETLYSKETRNEDGERVLSIVVPNLEDVPMATEPLGNKGQTMPDTKYFYVEREREALTKTKLEPE